MKITRPRLRWLNALFLLALTSLSCTWSLIDISQFAPTPAPINTSGNPTPTALAEITFTATLPAPLAPGETVSLGVLDEVTGLGLNPTIYPMSAVDSLHYTLKLPVPLNSVVKYRYYRSGTVTVIEDNAANSPIRYRLFHATGPALSQDTIASWTDTASNLATGNLVGVITDAASGLPLPNILVTAGGVTSWTDSLGQYVLQSLPGGVHTLVAYAPDGMYATFQQGATIQPGLTTSASAALQPARTVQVTFIVSTPNDTVSGAPVRLAGNLLTLGNTFADLSGGMSLVATRMPTLTPLDNGRQTLTLRLPIGADLRYKYSLGDGFWNAEHASDGAFVLRQLIVPAQDITIEDTVLTWASGPSAPILFEVNVPQNTPLGENVSIQFNPYGWTEPIPMWSLGGNRWVYKLYSPLNMLGAFRYRYCRNDQCGAADDAQTAGSQANSRSVSTSLTGEHLQDTVQAWAWLPETEPGTLVAVPVNDKGSGFWSGVEYSPNYHPNWQASLPFSMQNVQSLGANTLVLTPTWTAVSYSPLVFSPTPGADPLWADTLQAVQYTRAQNLNAVLFASPRLQPSTPDFWLAAPRSVDWWNTWFDRYRAFALYHADLATQSGAQALILGGDAVLPSLPGGSLVNGAASNAPADSEARWRAILKEVRQHFSGQLLWAHPYEDSFAPLPVFIDDFDAIYLLWSAPLADASNPSVESMTRNALARLDEDILPALSQTAKGVVIAINYPSARGAETGCVPAGGAGCLDWNALARPNPDTPSAVLDLNLQAQLYQATLQAINERSWVGGFISRGYYPPLPLMDKSASVRGKPAADLLWYWLPRLTGVTR